MQITFSINNTLLLYLHYLQSIHVQLLTLLTIVLQILTLVTQTRKREQDNIQKGQECKEVFNFNEDFLAVHVHT